MDGGLAALIAGIAGAIGGVGGGAAGAFFTGRAMVRQVHGEAAAEHGHWIREQRMQAYVGFIGAWDAGAGSIERLVDLAHQLFPEGHVGTDHGSAVIADGIDQLGDLILPVGRALEQVHVLGPSEVSEAATVFFEAFYDLHNRALVVVTEAAQRNVPERLRALATGEERDAVAARVAFIDQVRKVLGAPPEALR